MSEDNEMDNELEFEPSAVESMVDAILAQDFSGAQDQFDAEMDSRISDALDARRVEVANGISFSADADDELDMDSVDSEDGEESLSSDEEEEIE